jgi:5-methylcytosine-specific restriction endonuclease McrA
MEPWEDCNGAWKSKSAFFTWLREKFRRGWTLYPLSTRWKNSMCWPAPELGKNRFLGKCVRCEQNFAKSSLQIDHIVPAGSLLGWEDVENFARRMYSTSENLRLLCKPCHEIVTFMQNHPEVSDAEAVILKPCLAFSAQPAKPQVEFLESLGFSGEVLKNDKTRREVFENHVRAGGSFPEFKKPRKAPKPKTPKTKTSKPRKP